jgi:hypothetical protein
MTYREKLMAVPTYQVIVTQLDEAKTEIDLLRERVVDLEASIEACPLVHRDAGGGEMFERRSRDG